MSHGCCPCIMPDDVASNPSRACSSLLQTGGVFNARGERPSRSDRGTFASVDAALLFDAVIERGDAWLLHSTAPTQRPWLPDSVVQSTLQTTVDSETAANQGGSCVIARVTRFVAHAWEFKRLGSGRFMCVQPAVFRLHTVSSVLSDSRAAGVLGRLLCGMHIHHARYCADIVHCCRAVLMSVFIDRYLSSINLSHYGVPHRRVSRGTSCRAAGACGREGGRSVCHFRLFLFSFTIGKSLSFSLMPTTQVSLPAGRILPKSPGVHSRREASFLMRCGLQNC